MPSSNHVDNRDIQRDARAWSTFTDTKYTAALRQMQNPLAQGLLGERLSARQLIAILTDHPVVGSHGGDGRLGENGVNSEPVWTLAQDSDFIELVLIADFLRLFSPRNAASEPGVGSYPLKHTAELFLAPHCSYVSNGRLIWVAAALGLPLSGEAYKSPNLIVEIDDRQHDYVRRTVEKGQRDPQGHHYRPAGFDHLRNALNQASTGPLLVGRWDETVPEVEPAPFHDWLLLQLGRPDPVGRVAHDYSAGVKDSDHRLARQPEDLLDILDALGAASEFYEGGKRAVREWNTGGIRTDRIGGGSEDVEGHGAGAGSIERYDFSCPCGEGTVTEEHDNIPGFREHDVRLLCDRCRKSWKFVEGRSVRDWALWPISLSPSVVQPS